MILVTAYEGPDLDGSACAYAYAELLNKTGRKATAGIFGKVHREAQFVFDYLKLAVPKVTSLKEIGEFVLTDASETLGISKKIDKKKVIEIIDHRKSNDADQFENAKVQVELVGSCATLITEKFIQVGIEPSRESAILLYLAIISNTVNFKNSVTDDRDHGAANYLRDLYKIDENLIHQMFLHKSDLSDKTIEELFVEDGYINIHAGKHFTIFQLEIVGVSEFIAQNYDEIILELEKVKSNYPKIFFFLSCIDIEKGENTFVTSDRKAQDFLSKTFAVKFKGNIAKHKGIIMRKEIVPRVKEYLS